MKYLLVFVILKIISQVLLKKASLQKKTLLAKSYIVNMFTTQKVLIAYSISFVNIFIWILALSKSSLISAVMFSSFSYVLMLFVDYLFFGQKIHLHSLIGATLIVFSVILYHL